MRFQIEIVSTNRYGWKCDIIRCNSFNVGDNIELIVIVSSIGNVVNPETERDKNENGPTRFEKVIVRGHN